VIQDALNDGLVVSRYPSYAGAAATVGLEFILDVDLLALVGQWAAVQESGVDFTPVTGRIQLGRVEHKHHFVHLVFGHRPIVSPHCVAIDPAKVSGAILATWTGEPVLAAAFRRARTYRRGASG